MSERRRECIKRPGSLGGRILHWLFPGRCTCVHGSRWYVRHRGACGLVVVAVIAGAVIFTIAHSSAPSCGAFTAPNDIWQQDGECVGVSDGTHAFGTGDLLTLATKIHDINYGNHCQPGPEQTQKPPVTIAAMVTLGNPDAGVRTLHELQGIATALSLASQPDGTLSNNCARPIHLLVANMGSSEEAAVQDAQVLAGDKVVAVVGMGLSENQSAEAAATLNALRIPMVADVITAEGFDQLGSQEDDPSYQGCTGQLAGAADYQQHQWPYFFRVSYRVSAQVSELAAYLDKSPYLGTAPKGQQYYVVEPMDTTDPYTCTVLPPLEKVMPAQVHPLTFDSNDATGTEDQAAHRVCSQTAPATVFFTARSLYLGTFLDHVITLEKENLCDATQVTVVTQSDAAQLRTQAPGPGQTYESIRHNVLTSPFFKNGWLRVYYTPLADPDTLSQSDPSAFNPFAKAFTGLGFPSANLDDGWAIMGYDATATAVTAIEHLDSQNDSMDGPDVKANIADTMQPDSSDDAPGADGTIAFATYHAEITGNRAGPPPGVVRLCWPTSQRSDPPTVLVTNGQVGTCPTG